MSDDAILFSVDFPRTNPKDFFGIRDEGDSFVLETLRRRCCSDGKSSVAVAVSSHGQADVAAILKRDGTCPYGDNRTHWQEASYFTKAKEVPKWELSRVLGRPSKHLLTRFVSL